MASVSSISAAGVADRIKASPAVGKSDDTGDTGFMAMLDGLLQTLAAATGDAIAADGKGKTSGGAGREDDNSAGDDKVPGHAHVKDAGQHKGAGGDQAGADALSAATDAAALSSLQPADGKSAVDPAAADAAGAALDNADADSNAVALDPRFSSLIDRLPRHSAAKTEEAASDGGSIVSGDAAQRPADKLSDTISVQAAAPLSSETSGTQTAKARPGLPNAGDLNSRGPHIQNSTDAASDTLQTLAAGVTAPANGQASGVSGRPQGAPGLAFPPADVSSRRPQGAPGLAFQPADVSSRMISSATGQEAAAVSDAKIAGALAPAGLSGEGDTQAMAGRAVPDTSHDHKDAATQSQPSSAVANARLPAPSQSQPELQPLNASVLAFAAPAGFRPAAPAVAKTDAGGSVQPGRGAAKTASAADDKQLAVSSQDTPPQAGPIDPAALSPAVTSALGLEVARVSFMSHAARSDDQNAVSPAAQTVPAAADPAATGALVGQSAPSAGDVVAPAATATVSHTSYATPSEQVAVIFQKAIATGDRSMSIALDPIELGRVQVKLDFGKDGQVQASVIADRPETLALLKNDHASLHSALQNAGLNPDQGSLSFSLRGDGDNSGREASGMANNGRGYRQRAQFAVDIADMSSTPLAATQAGDGHLNLFV